MTTKKSSRVLVLASAVVLVGSAAFAGEITGNGKSLKNPDGTLNGKSACAWSGQEDEPETGQRAQSWGQIPKVVRAVLAAMGLHPGDACNPTKPPVEL